MRLALPLFALLALAGCADEAALSLDDAGAGPFAFSASAFHVRDAEAFRFDMEPTQDTVERHGVRAGRWVGVNVTVSNLGPTPRRLAGPADDALAVVLPVEVYVVDAEGARAKLFTSRRWNGTEMIEGDVYGPGESGVITLAMFESDKLAPGPLAFFIQDAGVRLDAVRDSDWTFRP